MDGTWTGELFAFSHEGKDKWMHFGAKACESTMPARYHHQSIVSRLPPYHRQRELQPSHESSALSQDLPTAAVVAASPK